MEIKGKVIQSLGVLSGTSKSGKSWSKATVIIETEGQYPKKVALDNMKESEKFSAIPVGTTGTFHVEIDSREFNGRWFTNVNCWKWELEQSAQQGNVLNELGVTGYSKQPTEQKPAQGTQSGDDLPF